MTSVFGDHHLNIPYQPVADLLAKYSARDPDKTAIVDLDGGSRDHLRRARPGRDRHRRRSQAPRRRQGRPRAAAVRRVPREAADLARRLAHRRGDLPDQHRDQREADGRRWPRRSSPPLILYHKDIDVAAMVGDNPAPRVRFGAWSADGTRDPQDEFFASLSRGRRAADLPERNDADDIACIVLHLGHHGEAQDRDLRPRRLLAERPRHAGIPRPHRGRPHARIPLVRLELGAGAEPAAVPAEGPDHAHRQALLAQPVLRMDPRQHGITFSAGVPTVLNMLLNKPLGYTAKDMPTLRLMSCSTAPLTAQQWTQFEEMYGVKLLQLYGMSETGWVCGNRHYTRKMGTVGLPALHQELEIVDGAGQGVPGRRRRRDHRRRPADGDRLPHRRRLDRSGARQAHQDRRPRHPDAEGFIRVTGRSKDLIIRGGVNIAPLEIDDVLLQASRRARCRRGRRAGQDLRRGGGLLRGRQGHVAHRGRRAGALRASSCRPPSCRSRC